MDWVFDNLQVLLVIAGVIAYWVNQRRREKAGEEAIEMDRIYSAVLNGDSDGT